MVIFNSQSEFFKYPGGAIREREKIHINIYIKRNIVASPYIIIEKRKDYEKELYNKLKLEWTGRNRNYDLYSAEFSIEESGHYFYSFNVDDIKEENPKLYELVIYKNDYETPDWIKGGIIYHIFVDRFFRTEKKTKNDNIIIRKDWGGMPEFRPDENGEILNNDFFGGNIDGIIKKLPYLQKLGVTVIYLSPIFEAYSNHKYDTGDYFKIDPMFGTEKTLKNLCDKAKPLGISIILDGVFSHTGADSKYFNKYGKYDSIGAYQSKSSPYYEWYTFNKWNDDYASWWGIKTLPEVNEENESYIDFITGENGVLKCWQNVGVKGWRLDVADELPNSFLNKIRSSIKTHNSDAYIVGEVWEDASNKFSYGELKEYFCGNQLDSVTNYPLKEAIIHYVKNKNCNDLYEIMNLIIEKYPPQTVNCLMNIIGTHDTVRILTVLGSNECPVTKEEMSQKKLSDNELHKGIILLKIASLLQFTLPGIPCIYYGDEVGLEGWKDPFNRQCYPWENENTEILNHYKLLADLRRNNGIFKDGKYRCLIHDKGIFAFERYNENGKIIIAANLGEEVVTLSFKENMTDYIKNINSLEFEIKNNNYLILTK